MKERPVIFNSEMVRAILDGRKTQTRRVIANVSPDNCIPLQKPTKTKDGIYTHVMDAPGHGLCPFGRVGDRLWVRETWSDVNLEGIPAVAYRADGDVYSPMDDESFLDEYGAFNYEDHRVTKYHFAAWYSDLIEGIEGVWRPSIHMPRWASRITLEITAVRVERLNDISVDDAKAEGVRALENNFGNGPAYCDYLLPNLDDTAEWYNRASDSYKSLWKSIYGEESWRANPWVWVIEFRRVEVEK
ncbi:hypothetical protein MOW49_003695 [Serratia marcescens]|uniref:hypothetical protein n=1 Tax=Serratia TaxID=613 RepID=UPI0018D6E4D0|nr:hypothetical protein [Serratia marcescens]EIY8599098.1 hypothetical protein [Serratia marcescens]EIY8856845.1 hypothetical protein [Serratia marcescens]EIY8863993.1 hypothetical protein [Serratia marcescens]EIY9017912.1 hypothetical protein [Serratia marcescens]MBH3237021.1 hypothetical protein [Serratia marcescens]